MAKISQEQLNNLIDCLQGTSDFLYQVCLELGFEEEDLTIEQLGEIDNYIFCCPSCGWWCDRGEAHNIDGEDFCEDCYEQEFE